jgi:hypothetical protein
MTDTNLAKYMLDAIDALVRKKQVNTLKLNTDEDICVFDVTSENVDISLTFNAADYYVHDNDSKSLLLSLVTGLIFNFYDEKRQLRENQAFIEAREVKETRKPNV